ncbi:MAG: hypothetical protein Q9160_009089 [Pyrenula sp. 1 TL-2023]
MDSSTRPTTAESGGRPTSTVRPQSQMSSAISEDADAERRQSQNSSMPAQSQPPPSRASRKGPPPKNVMARSSMGTGSNTTSSRPPSATSRLSRSHVPTISSHAFFRPMSSQQAQRQRGGRPYTGKTTASTQQDGQSDAGTDPRQSMSTLRQGPYIGDVQSPPSRGTEYTEDIGDRATSPTGQGTVRSLDDSTNLLNNGRQHRPQHLNLGKNLTTTEAPAKSPRSFRSGFSLGTKRQSQQQTDGNHQRLSSAATSPQQSEMKPADIQAEKASAGRNYEYFEGNTAFFWNGRFQNSRDRPVNIATGIFLIVPGVLFFVFSAPWIWHNISPAIPIVFAYIYFICISSFVHASVVDPGIYPRNIHPFPPADETEDPLTLGPPMNDWVMVKLATSDTAAMDVPVKYCKTCLFLFGASLAQCLKYQSQQHISFGSAINHWRVPFAMVIYGILGTCYPASLMGYHLFLMAKGQTTREYLSSHNFAKVDRHLPFTQGGILKNLVAVLGRPRPPTYLHFKKGYEEGDQRFGPRRGRRQAPLIEEAQGGGMEMRPVSGNHQAFQGPTGRISSSGR